MKPIKPTVEDQFWDSNIPENPLFFSELRCRLYQQAEKKSGSFYSLFYSSMFQKISFASVALAVLVAVLFTTLSPLFSNPDEFLVHAQETLQEQSQSFITYKKIRNTLYQTITGDPVVFTEEYWNHPDGSVFYSSDNAWDGRTKYMNIVDEKGFSFYYQLPNEADPFWVTSVATPSFCNVQKTYEGNRGLFHIRFDGTQDPPPSMLVPLNDPSDSESFEDSTPRHELEENSEYSLNSNTAFDASLGGSSALEIIEQLLTDHDWEQSEDSQEGRKVYIFTKKTAAEKPDLWDVQRYIFDAETYQLLEDSIESSDGSYSYSTEYLESALIPLQDKAEIFQPEQYGLVLTAANNSEALDLLEMPEGCYDFYGNPLDEAASAALLSPLSEDYFTQGFEKWRILFMDSEEDAPLELTDPLTNR